MTIKKLGHCCLFIETKDTKIVTDPGAWTDYPDTLPEVDIILITHEHQDHFHVPAIKEFLNVSPQAVVICNNSVAKLLHDEGITYEVMQDGSDKSFGDLHLEGYGKDHAEIYGEFGQVENTGFIIADELYYPGDGFFMPEKKVNILALPVAGPWLLIKEAIDFAKEYGAKKCFPVHDGMLRDDRRGPYHRVPKAVLEKEGIEFVELNAGEEVEF